MMHCLDSSVFSNKLCPILLVITLDLHVAEKQRLRTRLQNLAQELWISGGSSAGGGSFTVCTLSIHGQLQILRWEWLVLKSVL